ncbi:MAG: hypothetical protein K0U98_08285 [Deltaproteobacteria bacterium]|nr:hypothetical protein [Deltaproteobacteria bacterium]
MRRIEDSKKTVVAMILLVSLGLGATSVQAVDGVIEINAASAAVGSITPGDTPGFPVTLSEQGSYRLTSNLQVPDLDTTGILITASFVSLDLNGFTIFGPGGGLGQGDGIDGSSTSVSGVVIRNGTVRGMGSDGIRLSHRARVEKVHATGNDFNGINLGEGSIVRDCIASLNGGAGIRVDDGSSLVGNTSLDNDFNGLDLGQGSVAMGNASMGNDRSGLIASSSVTVVNNSLLNNGLDGARVGQGSLLQGNTARDNTLFGFDFTGLGSAYGGNVLSSNGSGTILGIGVQVDSNACNSSTSCP